MATTAQGGTFTFSAPGGNLFSEIVSLSVESPKAEVVDMTAIDAPGDQCVIVPTGQVSGGSVTVEYFHNKGMPDPRLIVSKIGDLSFASDGFTVSRKAFLETASTSASVGDLVRGTLTFRLTDYQG